MTVLFPAYLSCHDTSETSLKGWKWAVTKCLENYASRPQKSLGQNLLGQSLPLSVYFHYFNKSYSSSDLYVLSSNYFMCQKQGPNSLSPPTWYFNVGCGYLNCWAKCHFQSFGILSFIIFPIVYY